MREVEAVEKERVREILNVWKTN